MASQSYKQSLRSANEDSGKAKLKLTDSQWEVVKKIVPDERRRKHSLRLICEALFYLVKTGCQWRMLPLPYPPWQVVYYYFRTWKRNGTIELLHDKLVEWVRVKKGKKPEPSAGIIDTQCAATTSVGGEQRGFDAFKKVKGRWAPRPHRYPGAAHRSGGARRLGAGPGRGKAPAGAGC